VSGYQRLKNDFAPRSCLTRFTKSCFEAVRRAHDVVIIARYIRYIPLVELHRLYSYRWRAGTTQSAIYKMLI
jgi:hypothetical protein